MRTSVIFYILILSVLYSCGPDAPKRVKSNLLTYNNQSFQFGDKLDVQAEPTDLIDSIVYQINGKKTNFNNQISIDKAHFNYGKNTIKQTIHYTKKKKQRKTFFNTTITILSDLKATPISFEIVKKYKHNPSYFTQGFLLLDNDIILESTGRNSIPSKLVKYKLGSDKPIKEIELSTQYFAEGATIIDDKIYQITWKTRMGFVYDLQSLELLSKFQLPNPIKEGWGLTNINDTLVISDGTDRIYFLDANNPSKIIRTISVVGQNNLFQFINELEYIDGHIYANVWQNNIILKINPDNGLVVGRIGLKSLADQYRKKGVLNGIAYNPKSNTLLITGKNWPEIFEIKLN